MCICLINLQFILHKRFYRLFFFLKWGLKSLGNRCTLGIKVILHKVTIIFSLNYWCTLHVLGRVLDFLVFFLGQSDQLLELVLPEYFEGLLLLRLIFKSRDAIEDTRLLISFDLVIKELILNGQLSLFQLLFLLFGYFDLGHDILCVVLSQF